MSKPKREHCKCQTPDPICTECWKPIRLCNNWIERVTPTGIVFEKKKPLTKAQQRAFAEISKIMKSGSSGLALLATPQIQRMGKSVKSLSRHEFLRAAMSEGAFGFQKSKG